MEEEAEKASGNVKVLCRFRPLNEKESLTGDILDLNISPDHQRLSLVSSTEAGEPLKFAFDYIFTPESIQRDVYEIGAKPIVEAVMQGFNGTVFAYGQTSSGKTYTMTGPELENPETMGVIPRMVTTVFDNISNSEPCIEYAVKVSYCEIYLEKIKDLLDVSKTNLKIHEDKTRGVFIAEVTERYVGCDADVYDIMKFGLENRNVGSTNMNAVSSRSHSIFLITVTQTNNRDLVAKSGKLYLVDLAGSEKVGKTGAAGKRLEEAKNINKSLTMLGLVIYSLTDGKSTHVPYRDSKLTRVLQDSLGGNSKTALIITCSPSPFNEAETISTLRFGMRAKAIKNTPKINREYTVAELKLILAKCREEMTKKDRRIKGLEESVKKMGIVVPEDNSEKFMEEVKESRDSEQETDKNEGYEEIIAELEDIRVKMGEEVSYCLKIKNEISEKNEELDVLGLKVNGLSQEIKVLEQKLLKFNPDSTEKDELINRLTSTKENLEAERFSLNQKIIDLEKALVEQETEIIDLSKKDSQGRSKSSMVDFKGLLKSERDINVGYQKEIQHLRQNLNDLLSKRCPDAKLPDNVKESISRKERDKWIEERKKIIADLQNRIDRVTELEVAIDDTKDSKRTLESYMNEGERSLKKRTDTLERNLEQLTLMYHQLTSQKSQLSVDKVLADKKMAKMIDRNKSLEEENQRLTALCNQAEQKLNQLFEEAINGKASRASISTANIKKTIMGGGTFSKRSSIMTNKGSSIIEED